MSGDRFLSRVFECPACGEGIHDGDHASLCTVDAAGVEQVLWVGHRKCVDAEVARRNA
jgi:hypothetical protein